MELEPFLKIVGSGTKKQKSNIRGMLLKALVEKQLTSL